MSILFKINTTDFTSRIVDGSYEINSEEINETYTDANETVHYIHLRDRVKGKLELAFKTQAEYTAFVTAYSSAKVSASNSWPITVTPNNTLTQVNINARVTFKPARSLTAARADIIRRCTVEIEEL